MTRIIHLHDGQSWAGGSPLPPEWVTSLVATAARAPSVNNTQPWRFRLIAGVLELHADRARGLPALDPSGRELMMSCGAALYGLRLGVRQLGYVPAVSLLPQQAHPSLLARLCLGAEAPVSAREWRLLAAVPHRHTHRGPFSPNGLPPGLLRSLQHDATAEGASLVLAGDAAFQRLASLAAAAVRWQRSDRAARAENLAWARSPDSLARDGVPARAYPRGGARSQLGQAGAWVPGRLAMRDFDLGRRQGLAGTGGAAPAATAVLTTPGDTPADWLRAGQALHRVLVSAASTWVFASLYSHLLESRPLRAMVKKALGLTGSPQMVLQLGPAHVAELTARRPVSEVLTLR